MLRTNVGRWRLIGQKMVKLVSSTEYAKTAISLEMQAAYAFFPCCPLLAKPIRPIWVCIFILDGAKKRISSNLSNHNDDNHNNQRSLHTFHSKKKCVWQLLVVLMGSEIVYLLTRFYGIFAM